MSRIVTMGLLVGALMFAAMPQVSNAGIFDRLFGRGATRTLTTPRSSVPQSSSARRFSYDPSFSASGSSATRGSNPATPRYMLQKSDPNKYRN